MKTLDSYLIFDGDHPLESEMLMMKKEGYPLPKIMEGRSTQKIYKFDNGYGASVVKGYFSHGWDEMAVIKFLYSFNPPNGKKLPKKKRIRNKILKKYTYSEGFDILYNTSVTEDVKRYSDLADLNRDLIRIMNLKEGEY